MKRELALFLALMMALSLWVSPALAAESTGNEDIAAVDSIGEESDLTESAPEEAPEPEPETSPAVKEPESEKTASPAGKETKPEKAAQSTQKETTPEESTQSPSKTSEPKNESQTAPEATETENEALPAPAETEPKESQIQTAVPEEGEAGIGSESSGAEEPIASTEDLEDGAVLRKSDEGTYFVTDKKLRTVTVLCEAETDIYKALNKALKQAGTLASKTAIYTVIVPKGSYQVSATLCMYSNTTLQLTGVTLNYTKSSGNCLLAGSSVERKTAKGYTGFVNMTILNGTFRGNKNCKSCLIRMAHATNVTLRGVTFDDCWGCHEFEVAGVKDLTIEKCIFQNIHVSSSENGGWEAIQLDILANDSCFSGYVNDGTMMKNVTIQNCTFRNCPRGIGAHNQLLGGYHTNLIIKNNSFSNLKDAAIFLTAAHKCTIENNTITKCGRGIYFIAIRPEARRVFTKLNGTTAYQGKISANADTVIRNNRISVKVMDSKWCNNPSGIHLYGTKFAKAIKTTGEKVSAGTYAISNVKVMNNTITTTGSGIRLERAKSCTVSGNTLKFSGKGSGGFYGITLTNGSTAAKIVNNAATGFPKYGIRLEGSCSATEIRKNTVKRSGSYGIYLVTSTVTSVKSNILSSCGSGIYLVRTKSDSVASNQITSCGKYGIRLSSSAKATKISSNRIKNGSYGIYASGSTAGTISSNTISSPSKNGIYLTSQKAKSSVTGNSISSSKAPLIRLNNGAKKGVSVTKNTLKGGKKYYALYIDKGNVTIKSNKSSGCKGLYYAAKGVTGTANAKKISTKK